MAKKDQDSDSPETPPTVDPWQVMDRLTSAIEALAKRQEAAPNDSVQLLMAKLGETMARVAESNIEGSKLIADETRRAHRPSNEIVPMNSVFNRRGNLLKEGEQGPRKPPLKCLMLLPWLAEWESLTREEVELLNLLEPGEYLVKRIDNSKVRLSVELKYRVDGVTPSNLIMTHDTAFNNDNFRLAPPLADMLRQILRQHPPQVARVAAAILSDEEEEALIEAGELTVSV